MLFLRSSNRKSAKAERARFDSEDWLFLILAILPSLISGLMLLITLTDSENTFSAASLLKEAPSAGVSTKSCDDTLTVFDALECQDRVALASQVGWDRLSELAYLRRSTSMTTLAAIGTIFAFAFSGLGLMLLAYTLHETRLAAKAAQDAAEHAARSNEGFELFTKREQRAYLTCPEIRASDDGLIALLFRNSGQTPAHKIAVSVAASGGGGDGPSAPLAPFQVLPRGDIGPGEEFTLLWPADADLWTFSATAGRVWVWGEVTYFDAFGDVHETSFRGWHETPLTRGDAFAWAPDGNVMK